MTKPTNLKAWPAVHALMQAPALPELGPGPRAGVEPLAALDQKLNTFFKENAVPLPQQELIRGAIYLWHDHHEASHQISQSIENPDGSLLHGILHRREPDYWNSKYWLRRVGQHPCYATIGRRVTDYLNETGDSALASKLVPKGLWDAYAFVDACEKAGGPGKAEQRRILEQIQQIEFESLLAHFLSEAGVR